MGISLEIPALTGMLKNSLWNNRSYAIKKWDGFGALISYILISK